MLSRSGAFSNVPKTVIIFLLLSLLMQISWHYSFSYMELKRDDLALPPRSSVIRLLSLNDPHTAAKIVMLWLQALDNQPGVSIPLKELDYNKVIGWLDLILELDNKIEYPLLAAIRFYAEVQDQKKQRKMIQYVSRKFLEYPDERWQFMAHAVYIARHRIKDMQLALLCAQLIRKNALGDNVPHWARQMELLLLENMGELESARILIGGLLKSGKLNDPRQRKFLGQRLKEIEEKKLQGVTDNN